MADTHTKFDESLMEAGQLRTVDSQEGPSPSSSSDSKWSTVRQKLRRATAEFVGTAILTTFGCGAIAHLALTPNSSWGAMSASWGLALTLAIYASGGISGAALNPAVTLAMAIFRDFAWIDVPLYWIAQTLGAFVGALFVYVLNGPAIRALDQTKTIGIFITGLQSRDTSTGIAFFAEFLGTAVLVFAILATSQGRGITPADPRFQPVVIGMTLASIGLSIGTQTGFALNPARDFAPRVFVAIAGWGGEAFSRQDYYFWVPIVAPFVGAIGGAFGKITIQRMGRTESIGLK
ncbi:hypothetical protein FBU30_005667 [Linnemannia zychae]|nr:hypothetical protein FBU30_005667 [Linnemannia zychae]